MNRKIFTVAAALFLGLALVAGAAEPMTYREISMMLRNGETPQFVLEETAKRKLLKPLASEEEHELAAIGAPATLIEGLRSPSLVLSPEQAGEYLRRSNPPAKASTSSASSVGRGAMVPSPSVPAASPTPATQAAAPGPMEIQFTAFDGSTVSLAEMRGKVVVMYFWATGNGQGMAAIPRLVDLYEKYHYKGFEMIGVSLDKERNSLRNAVNLKGIKWPQYFDGGEAVLPKRLGIRSIPTLWIINKKGFVVGMDVQLADLDVRIDNLMRE